MKGTPDDIHPHQPGGGMPEVIFDRIEAALNTLDASTDTRIQSVDERLRALGVTVDTYATEPADVWNDTRLHLGYARIAGRYCLVVRRVRGEESSVEPLRGTDRATRIAVVDKLPHLLEAIEAELRRRSSRLAPADPARAPIGKTPAPAAVTTPAPTRAVAPPASSTAEPARAKEVTLPSVSEVDAPLQSAPGGNGGVHPAAAAGQESVDHMFRLFSRKGK
jgi:hypothetical protein